MIQHEKIGDIMLNLQKNYFEKDTEEESKYDYYNEDPFDLVKRN